MVQGSNRRVGGRGRVGLVLAAVAAGVLSTGIASAQGAPAPPAKDDTWQNPAKAVDPPILLAPQEPAPPTSTSGTDLLPPAEPIRSAPPAPPVDPPAEARQDQRLRLLEARIAQDEQKLKRLEERSRFWRHLKVEGYIQPQLLVQSYNPAASPNTTLNGTGRLPPGITANDIAAKPDGTTTNGTFFRVRRARLRTIYETDIARMFLQIDAFPVGGTGPGIGTILRNAEATGIVRWTRDVRTEITAGLFMTPFRREVVEISMVRPWIERTWFVQNVFPLERDYGVHASTYAFGDALMVDVTMVNGQRLGEKTFTSLPDLNRSKDGIARATYKLGFVTLGTSGYLGRGQIVDPVGLRFKQFGRWALNYEATAIRRFFPRLGETKVYAELTFAQNMDAGVQYAFAVPKIPTRITDDVTDVRERGFYLRAEQDLGRWATFGYRYDMYTPNVSIKNNARDTHAILLVGRISPNLRWLNELGVAIDNVHAEGTPPPSKHITYFSTVLQAQFN